MWKVNAVCQVQSAGKAGWRSQGIDRGEFRRHCVSQICGKRQTNYEVDRGGGWDYRLTAAQASGALVAQFEFESEA
jgi:hypothetical protein